MIGRGLLYFAIVFASLIVVVVLVALSDVRQRIRSLEARQSEVATRYGRMSFERWGDGKPLIVVHGAGGGFDQGRLLAEAMVDGDVDRIAVSRFGYLGSDLPADASVAAQADALLDLIDQLQLAKPDFLAMSGGVPPVLKFAERHPDRAGRLVLLSSAPFTPLGGDIPGRPVPTWVYEVLLGNDVVYWLMTRLARSMLENAFDARGDLEGGMDAQERAFVVSLVDGFLPASRRRAGLANEGAAVAATQSYAIERIASPALIVHARDDRLNPPRVAETLANRLPQAQLVMFERGGHLLLSHHAELRRIVREFLAGADGPSADDAGDREGRWPADTVESIYATRVSLASVNARSRRQETQAP